MNTVVSRLALALGLALVPAACGNGGEGSGTGSDREGGALVGQPPPQGGSSPKFGLPLPRGAAPEPGSSSETVEAFRAPSELSLPDVNAFFAAQADGKPLAGFDWCGGVPVGDGQVIRVWLKPGGTSQLRVALTADPKGVLIVAGQDDAAPATTCPPASPTNEQPFEGPN